ncbi:hypothetical protein P7C73_g5624, partial [Tremellales sp. Uapishka_1]
MADKHSTQYASNLTASGRPRKKRFRSITGCAVCRRRRVKCDEQRPTCGNCQKHPLRQCSYEFPVSERERTERQEISPVSSGPEMHSSSADSPDAVEIFGSSSSSSVSAPHGVQPLYTPFPLYGVPENQDVYVDPSDPYPANDFYLDPLNLNSLQDFPLEPLKAKVSHLDLVDPGSLPISDAYLTQFQQPQQPQQPFIEYPAANEIGYQTSQWIQESTAPLPKADLPPNLSVSMVRSVSAPLYKYVIESWVIVSAADGDKPRSPAMAQLPVVEILLNRLSRSGVMDLTGILSIHNSIVKQCFTQATADDPEGQMLRSMTSLLMLRHRNDLTMEEGAATMKNHHMALLNFMRPKPGNVINERNAGSNLIVLMCLVADPTPQNWPATTVHQGIDVVFLRGGPGFILGVSPPLPGYDRGPVHVFQPLHLALLTEFGAMLELFVCLIEGTAPIAMTVTRPCWLGPARVAQLRVCPTLPDAVEDMFGIPRCLVPTFAHTLVLVSQLENATKMHLHEQLELEAATLRAELDHVWPPRLTQGACTRIQYGGRILHLSTLILMIHRLKGLPTSSPELQWHVKALLDLCLEAVASIGHLSGWIWFITIGACAAESTQQRDAFTRLLSFARSPIGERDSTYVAVQILARVWLSHDLGMPRYHIPDAVRDDPSLRVLML